MGDPSAGIWISGILGMIMGASLAGLWMRARMAEVAAGKKLAEARLAALDSEGAKTQQTFEVLADAALRSSQQVFLQAARSTLETVRAEMTGDLAQRQTAVEGVVKPLAASLSRLESQIREFESSRERAFGSLGQQIDTLAQGQLSLQNALRSPQARGRWGEVTLRRVAELAGMVERCDFFDQQIQNGDGGRMRPDMVVRLPGDRSIVVDAKAPLAAFMEAMEARDEESRRNALIRHGQQVAKHVEQLSAKSYWSQFQPAPEFVVLFLPGDHFFSAALEHNRTLLEKAATQKILVATPTTLIAILKGACYGWRQEQVAHNAEQIRRVAAELYDRMQNLHEYFAETGRSLGKAVDAYNRSVGSLEARVFPSLRRVRDLGATTGAEPVAPERIDVAPRTPAPLETN